MRANFGLRGRFIAAILLIVGLVSGAFGVALDQFVEVLESELLDRTLEREPPESGDLTGYIVREGQPDELPAELRDLPPGLYDDVYIGKIEHFVGRRDVNGARLYLTLDEGRVDDLETRLIALGLISGLLAFILAALAAAILVRVVLRPVSRLAQMVSELNPDQRGVRLTERFGDRDIGQIAEAIDRYLARLDALIEREQAFTQDASHELRTPLATLISGIELLQQQPDLTPLARERLARLQRAGAQSRAVVEALLFLAREGEEPSAEPCDLERIVQTAVEGVRDLAEKKTLQLRVETAPVSVRAPSGMAACVVNNLLANAIHFTERGRVELRLTADRLTVQDTGIGIPPDDLAHIFERRFRGPASRGLGLGLYLVQRICDRLGWKVQVSSAPGTGTRFEVLFNTAGG